MLTVVAVLAVFIAVTIGPLPFLVRAALRHFAYRDIMQRWQRPATIGLGTGLVVGTLLSSLLFSAEHGVIFAVLSLLILLAGLDLAWRWLPYEWTIPLLILGLWQGFVTEDLDQSLFGAITGGGFLFVMHQTMRIIRGIEGIGIGDMWLAAAMGAYVGPWLVLSTISIAAITALATSIFNISEKNRVISERYGVAYGTHLCVVFVFFVTI